MKKLVVLFLFFFVLSACTEGPYTFKDTSYNYSIESSFDLIIQKLPTSIPVLKVELNDHELDLSNLIHDQTGLKLKSSYIKTLDLGEYTFLITTENGEFTLNLRVLDSNRPYIISKSTVESDLLSNQIFIFELFGGSIKSVTGNDIKSTDYTIKGNELTIKKGFIREAFETNEALETLVIGYTLEVGSDLVVGYIFITQKS